MNYNDITPGAERIAEAAARIITGPFGAAISGILRVGSDRAQAIADHATKAEEQGEDVSAFSVILGELNEDLVALGIMKDVLRMVSFDDFRKSQDRVRSLMAFSPEQCEELMSPSEFVGAVAMVQVLRHVADTMERVIREPIAEQIVAIAEKSDRFNNEERLALRSAHAELAQSNAKWIEEGRASMDEFFATKLFHEVGLRKETDSDE